MENTHFFLFTVLFLCATSHCFGQNKTDLWHRRGDTNTTKLAPADNATTRNSAIGFLEAFAYGLITTSLYGPHNPELDHITRVLFAHIIKIKLGLEPIPDWLAWGILAVATVGVGVFLWQIIPPLMAWLAGAGAVPAAVVPAAVAAAAPVLPALPAAVVPAAVAAAAPVLPALIDFAKFVEFDHMQQAAAGA